MSAAKCPTCQAKVVYCNVAGCNPVREVKIYACGGHTYDKLEHGSDDDLREHHYCPSLLTNLLQRAVNHIKSEVSVLPDESGCSKCPHYVKHPKIPYICRKTKLMQPTAADCPRAAILSDAQKMGLI